MSAISGTRTPYMRTRPAVVVAVAAAVLAFAAGPVLFAPAAELPAPTGTQVPLFVALAAVEALIFGAGIAFALFGRGAVSRLVSTSRRTTAVHLAVTWALVSWWPHDGLHMANGVNIDGLLAIEYGFHVTLIAAAAVLAWVLLGEARERSA